ncbi:MAG: peptidoglycan editing factor PgeF [bacterium]
MNQVESKGITLFQDPAWQSGYPTVLHGFFTRRGGTGPAPLESLHVALSSRDSLGARQENLRRAAAVFGIRERQIACLRQVHGADVVRIPSGRNPGPSGEPPRGDAQITDRPGTCLAILTADCLPVLLLDPDRPAVGAVHAGWRGTLQSICSHVVSEMRKAFSTRAARLRALLGPCIGACCYEVGEDVAHGFLGAFPEAVGCVRASGPNRWKVDLSELNRWQLLEAGLLPEHIGTSTLCTRCRPDLFFSFRGQGEAAGRQISLVGLGPASRGLKTVPVPSE